ncbi:hypothetical protein QQF64_024179 [Cirrhinus molitorella]|uniref:Uncharacterized protein n=1 Tax=Cirrhinus molitorella TaxID=172907 RepID=A0ABR3NLE9_9TELE
MSDKGKTQVVCVHRLTIIYPPESRVRAAVFQAGVLPFIHIYNVPVFSADGHGEQDEAEQPAQTHKGPQNPVLSDTLKHMIPSLILQMCPGWRKNQLSATAG